MIDISRFVQFCLCFVGPFFIFCYVLIFVISIRDDGEVPQSKTILGPIENADLLEGEKLKQYLQEGQDYVLLHSDAWESIKKW